MRLPTCVAAVFLLLGTCEPATAESQPEFSLRFSAWEASDVVVIDLQRRVLEVWKGDLRAGAELPIESWHLMEGADISYDRWGNAADETPKGQPDRVTGRRRVVFLIRDPSKSAADPNAWKAASIGNHVDTCAVWVEGKSAFAVQPWERPEPGIVRPHMTETALKTEVVQIGRAHV